MAGQMIMQGFVGFRIPIWLRRVITMVPAFVVVAYGVQCHHGAGGEPGDALSIALPLPMIALLMFTGRADIMGTFVNGRMTRVAAVIATALVLCAQFQADLRRGGRLSIFRRSGNRFAVENATK